LRETIDAMIMGRSRTRMKRRTRIITDLNRASARVAVGRYERNASSRAFGLLPRYSLGGLNYANRHERFGMVLELERENILTTNGSNKTNDNKQLDYGVW